MTQDEEAALRERDHLNQLYRQIFQDDRRGARILEDLHDRFVRAPNPNDFTQEGMLRAFVHSHQREVIEYIARRIGAASDVPEAQPTQDDTL